MRMICGALAVVACALAPVPAFTQTVDLSKSKLVDLTHTFDRQTLYWPTSTESFDLKQLAFGKTPGGWFYASNALSTPEHGGTHLDAPIHFGEGRQFVHEIPLNRLVGPAVVIDVAAKAATNPDYLLSPADVQAFERRHGRIQPGTIVLLRTDWSKRWPRRKAYLGDDTPGDASKLHFPSFGEAAAKLLIQDRRIAAIGVDVASTDYGASRDFLVHRVAAAANVPGFENLTNLDQLPPTGAVVIALPMKVGRGSGAPLRAIAIVPTGGGR